MMLILLCVNVNMCGRTGCITADAAGPYVIFIAAYIPIVLAFRGFLNFK